MSVKANEQFRFVNMLAMELTNGDIKLPSLPDVVIKIRNMLENDDCDFDKISSAVSVDPVLVSKLFVYANSSLYSRAGVTIDTLEAAIGRLGFEVVRNAAMSIAMEQLYRSEKHSRAKKHIQSAWARSMKMSCMAWSIARSCPQIDDETAYLAGLMHDVGTLYIITKTEEFPEMLGDPAAFKEVVAQWNPQISKSIIESWGFNEEMAESADSASYVTDKGAEKPRLADVMHVAEMLIELAEEDSPNLSEVPACRKLGVGDETISEIRARYGDKLQGMQSALS